MRALILAAGYGTRLGKLTKDIPKPMLKIGGKPVLEHLVDHLKKYGITEIIVNLHYKPEVIMNYFGTRLLYFYEPELLGEKGTIKALKSWFYKEDFVVMNGDTLTNINLALMRSWMALNRFEAPIRAMDEKVYTGTTIYPSTYFMKGYKRLNKKDWLGIGHGHADSFWIDIGTPEGLKKARKYYAKKKSHNLPKV